MLYIQQSKAMIEVSIPQMFVALASVFQKSQFALEIDLRKMKGDIETRIWDIYHSPSIATRVAEKGIEATKDKKDTEITRCSVV